MVRSFLFSAALLSGFVYAAPRPSNPDGDSSLGNEVAVSAPFGIPLSDTSELAAQRGTQYVPPATIAAPAPTMAAWRNYGSPAMAPAAVIATPVHAWSTPAATRAPAVAPPVIYGSGSSSNVNSLDSCVQQCMARFNPLNSGNGNLMPPSSTENVGSVGGGATHTVIVAPSQGVLRYVPFAINASVGDTISFQWRANNHYVARSSALHPCNGTQDATFFNSGKQNTSFTFTQVVNDTAPIFYFCATGTHCQQGMFGIINPPTSLVSDTTLGSMITDLAANNSGLSNAWQQTNMKTAGTDAFGWGSNLDMAQMPDWSHPLMAENMLYNRQVFAANPEVMGENGEINMGNLRGPMSVPPDLDIAALAATAPATTLSLANPAAATAGAAVPAAANPQGAAAPDAPAVNAAPSLSSSSLVIAIVAAFATLLAL